jgi:hypothetical protein
MTLGVFQGVLPVRTLAAGGGKKGAVVRLFLDRDTKNA